MMTQLMTISATQKIVIYETKAWYYVVGSNNTETRFRVLKIDRMEPRDLVLTDDKVEYSRHEIREVLHRIDLGNRSKTTQKGGAGLKRTVSAFGIVGFVRFLEGYYMVVITKRRRVALIGGHTVYKVEDTTMIYIPNDVVKVNHSDEQRYVKMFQNVDLSSNFYFSYSYNLTQTLQYNLSPSHLPSSCNIPTHSTHVTEAAGHVPEVSHSTTTSNAEDVEDASNTTCDLLDIADDSPVSTDDTGKTNDETGQTSSETGQSSDGTGRSAGGTGQNTSGLGQGSTGLDQGTVGSGQSTGGTDGKVYAIRTAPYKKYMWNEYLLQPIISLLHSDWILFLVHGFIGQSNISVFGQSVYLTLIARRSNKHAGTRFLKRGATTEGDVANEVETEQIVHCAGLTSCLKARMTSFTQLRGSIPLHWSQDVSKIVPKPPISLDQSDPYGFIAGQHFNELMGRHGAPVIVLDLVKRREKRPHESLISEEYVEVIRYLNQFLSSSHHIKYIGFDMARLSKSRRANVLSRLEHVTDYCVRQTGFFQNQPGYYCREIRPNNRLSQILSHSDDVGGRSQMGVVRTNCVDCLDRTNTAQFSIGKSALAAQLHALCVIDQPKLDFDSDCVRMLEDLYEDHGDTLALQYGGSQLVHRIKGYRKVAPWTSSSRDIMQTLSRYYSNAFSDAEKQAAMNVFLGVFVPEDGQVNIWDLTTDFYLHNKMSDRTRTRAYTQWWQSGVIDSLPLPRDQVCKGESGSLLEICLVDPEDERVNIYNEHHKPFELTTLEERYCFNMPNSVRDFMPKSASNYSPMTARVRNRDTGERITDMTNPNMIGKDSTSSAGSEEASSSDSEGSDIDRLYNVNHTSIKSPVQSESYVQLKDFFPTMKQVYGIDVRGVSKSSEAAYKRFSVIGQNSKPMREEIRSRDVNNDDSTVLIQTSVFPLDSVYSVEVPSVSSRCVNVYREYVRRGEVGASTPAKHDLDLYKKHVKSASSVRPSSAKIS